MWTPSFSSLIFPSTSYQRILNVKNFKNLISYFLKLTKKSSLLELPNSKMQLKYMKFFDPKSSKTNIDNAI